MNCYNTKCPICFIKPKNNELIIKSSCKHFICLKCLQSGAYNLRKCPMCRFEISKAFIHEYESDKKIITLGENNICPCPECLTKSLNELEK